jgi:tetratricopeptide (TPR) repeat protein
MNHKIALEIIEANREYLLHSSSMALSNLANIHKDFDDIPDEAIVMSLALNDSIASMRFHAEYDKAITRSRLIIERFPDTEHRFFIALHLAVIGRCLAMSGDYLSAEENLLQVLQIGENELEPSDDTTKLNTDALHDLAMTIDMSNGDPERAIKYLDKAMKLLDGTSFEIRKGLCLMGSGNIKYKEGKKEDALNYYIRACEIFDTQYNFSNLGTAYSNIALCYSDLGQMEKAEENLMRAHELRIRTSNHDTIANRYYSLGRFYEICDNAEKSFINMLTCRDYSLKSANKKLYKESL